MNNPDCGYHRTGQPRCAQLIAKTCNLSEEMRRTQQAIFPVSPSHGRTKGLRYVASRVSPSGNCVSEPSVIHDKSFFISFFFAGPRMKPTTGTANKIPATAFSTMPAVINIWRRDTFFRSEEHTSELQSH